MTERQEDHPPSMDGSDYVPARAIWGSVLQQLGRNVSAAEYAKWLADLVLVAEVNGEILLAARDDLTRSRVEQDYLRLINTVWRRADPGERRVRVESRRNLPAELAAEAFPPGRAPVAMVTVEPPLATRGRVRSFGEMTIDNLVVGEANRNGANFVRRIAEGDLPPFGYTTVYGLPGVGKTHHLKAVHAALVEAGRADEVIYITANEFLTSYVAGARAGDTSALKARVRGARLVLFDDLHVICGKAGTEREFWETLRAITAPDGGEPGGHVVVAADAPPSQISGLSARIRSELQGGALIELAAPEPDMLCAIMASKVALIRSQAPEFDLPEETIRRIVYSVSDGPRGLTGIVYSIYSETTYAGRPVTEDIVNAVIQRHAGSPAGPSLEEIKRAVCEVYEITRAVLDSGSRLRQHCEARHVTMHLARDLTDKSYPQIGRALGNRHHTSCMHGDRKIAERLSGENGAPPDTELRCRIDRVRQVLHRIVSQRGRNGQR